MAQENATISSLIHESINFLRVAVRLTVLCAVDAHYLWEGSEQPRPDHFDLILLPIEAMPQPYAPLDVEIRSNPRHDVPINN